MMNITIPRHVAHSIFFNLHSTPSDEMRYFIIYSNASDQLITSQFVPIDPHDIVKEKTVQLFSDYIYSAYNVEMDDLPMRFPSSQFHTVQAYSQVVICAETIAMEVLS